MEITYTPVNMTKNQVREIIELYIKEQLSITNISHLLKMSRETVSLLLHANNISVRRSKSHLSNYQIDRIVKLHQQGKTTKEISNESSHDSKTVIRILHTHNVRMHRGRVPGGQETVIQEYAAGMCVEEIALRHNVSIECIRDKLRNANIEFPKKKSNSIELAMKRRVYFPNQSFFEEINTEEKRYWLGFFAADGFFTDGDTGIGFTLKSTDWEHIEKFFKAINVNKTVKFKSNFQTWKGTRKEIRFVTGSVFSKKIAADVRRQLNLTPEQKKSYHLTFPTGLTDDLTRHFIRGVLDGDGTIEYRGPRAAKVVFYGTEDVCRGIHNVLVKNLGISSAKVRVKKPSSPHLYQVAWSGRIQVLTILDWLYADSSVYLNRKYEKYKGIPRALS